VRRRGFFAVHAETRDVPDRDLAPGTREGAFVERRFGFENVHVESDL
jgi:hypothetical protein